LKEESSNPESLAPFWLADAELGAAAALTTPQGVSGLLGHWRCNAACIA